MAAKVDMSLDDIIKTTKTTSTNRRGGGGGAVRSMRGRGRGIGGIRRGIRGGGNRGGRPGAGQRSMNGGRQNFGQRGNVDGRWSHDMYQGGGGGRTQMMSSGPAKLLISNLDFGVSDSDIHELFAEFGTMRNAAVHYDRSGRSLGTSHVVFERHADALKAIKQYNGVHLDGRPMNISLEGGASGGSSMSMRTTPPVKRLSQRARPIGGGFGGGGGGRGGRGGMRGSPRGNRGARGTARGGGRGRGVGRGARAKVPTAEELDAELDAYVNQVNK